MNGYCNVNSTDITGIQTESYVFGVKEVYWSVVRFLGSDVNLALVLSI